jgi:hypothetical protein
MERISTMVTADTLRVWSERLCHLATGGRAAAAALLEVTAPLVDHRDFALVPPPEGATRIRIFDDLSTHTTIDYIEVQLAPPGILLAALEATFGPGEPSVRVSATSPYKQWFRVELPGAPCTCDVFAEFPTRPSAASSTASIMLRRNPSPAPKR